MKLTIISVIKKYMNGISFNETYAASVAHN